LAGNPASESVGNIADLALVRNGSFASVPRCPRHVRFTPEADIRQRDCHVRFVPKATDAPQQTTSLFDHLIGGDEQHRRNG